MMRSRPNDHDAPFKDVDGVIGAPARKFRLIGPGQYGLGIVAILGLVGSAFGIDPRALIGGRAFLQSAHAGYSIGPLPPNERIRQLATSVLAETSEVWADVLPKQKAIPYTPPQLMLYDGATRSACGLTFTAIGPFYCPLDQKIYLDASFFATMKARLGSGGDFAYTYLLAHEVGHHVQNELGILRKAQAVRRSAFGSKGNPISIRVELMADCYAGIWAGHALAKYHLIKPSDVEKLSATAWAIGDDRLQRAAQGLVVATTFTHGTSAQRVYWFDVGRKSGKLDACNTFAQQ
jgi:hypothetical protein